MNKITFMVGAFAGAIILLIGIYMKLSGNITEGYTSGRYGNIQHGMLDGYGIIIVGILLILLSLLSYAGLKDSEKSEKNLGNEYKYKGKRKNSPRNKP